MNTAVPPGNCVTHGYHGLAACPRCSSSTLPAAPISAGQAHAAVSPFDLIRDALAQPRALNDRVCPQCRDAARRLAVLDQLQRDHESLSEGFKRNLRLGTEEIRAERDAAVREAKTLREALGPEYHVYDCREDGWSVQHPVSCRDQMLDCPVHLAVRSLGEPPVAPGRWRLDLDTSGHPVFSALASSRDTTESPTHPPI